MAQMRERSATALASSEGMEGPVQDSPVKGTACPASVATHTSTELATTRAWPLARRTRPKNPVRDPGRKADGEGDE